MYNSPRWRPHDWDRVHTMRTLRALPHSSTKETANYLMLERELRLPDELYGHTPPLPEQSIPNYVLDRDEQLSRAHDTLGGQQKWLRGLDREKPLLCRACDQVWLLNKRRRKAKTPNCDPNMSVLTVFSTFLNHTYQIEG